MNRYKDISKKDLVHQCDLLQQQLANAIARIHQLEEQQRLANHRRLGVSSEHNHEEQMLLFNEAEVEAEAVSATPEPTVETITYREAILADLPDGIIEYRLFENEQICSCCHGPLHEMSTEVRRELKIIPVQLKVVKHVCYVYSCRHCERGEGATPVITVPLHAMRLAWNAHGQY
jgi:transposase